MRLKRATFLLVAAHIVVAAPAFGQNDSSLTPFIGETVKQFEARRQRLEDDRSIGVSITIDAEISGHFFVEPLVYNQPVRMVVDTGASIVALTYEDAERIGARVSSEDFTVRISTANGPVTGAPYRLDEIRIGAIVARDIEAVILPKGRLEISLLGMSFFHRVNGFNISRRKMTIHN